MKAALAPMRAPLRLISIACVFTTSVMQALAQFSSGSTGADGALDILDPGTPTTIVFDPAVGDIRLDPDGDNVYHFTTITIPANVTLRLGADVLGHTPVHWLASGAVRIEGTLDLNGQAGHACGQPPVPGIAGAGGFNGGPAASESASGSAGDGPGGARYPGGGFDHAGHVTANGGAIYGNLYLMPLIGGSGGAGNGGPPGAGGGGGGGAILIASDVSIDLPMGGSIRANGGNAGQQCTSDGTRGGAGSGGAIRLMAPRVTIGGSLSATGGAAPFSSASVGRIRIESFQRTLAGASISPGASFGVPFQVFPPVSGPTVRVVSVAGVAVIPSPTGSFQMPDVTIEAVSAVPVELSASNVPPGTILNLRFVPETGDVITAMSSPLMGSFADSTASASVTFPRGFSRGYILATWTP